ncbi:unnamed protein product [Periconia digitata]|uniref:Uncharacterized protein n=1 Tax=Periconia digitata TaxID=1303443 RepID=A0A9W4U4H9_9PLEO|nr:unnamed protein product [Periconia digitata]
MELDLGLDTEEHEPTVLEYARFYGLCRDYLLDKPDLGSIISPLDKVLEQDLRDPPQAPILTNSATELIKERLNINTEAASILRSVGSIKCLDDQEKEDIYRRHRVCDLKQEVPVLKTDHELDMLRFGNTATPDLTKLRIPLKPLDEENDKDLGWLDKYTTSPLECDQQVKAEKLTISKAHMSYLQGVIIESRRILEAESPVYKKPLTPPLLPVSPPMTPYVPSSPANHLPILSDSSDSVMAEVRALEEQIMGADTLELSEDNDGQKMLLNITRTSSDILVAEEPNLSSKRKLEQLYVEPPLTPPTKRLKTVIFSDIPQYISDIPPVSIEEGENTDLRIDPESVKQSWEPIAKEAQWRVENERLSAADTTKRVDIPFIEFIPPIAPWDEYKQITGETRLEGSELHSQTRFLSRINRIYPSESWHGVSRLNRELPIEPFNQRPSKIAIEEMIHGQEQLDLILSEIASEDIVGSSTTIWKRDGLRLLESDDEDEKEELEPMRLLIKGNTEISMDDKCLNRDEVVLSRKAPESPGSLAKVRIPDNAQIRSIREEGPIKIESSVSFEKARKIRPKIHDKYTMHEESDGSLMFGGGEWSATSALKNFMAIQGIEIKETEPMNEKQAISSSSKVPSSVGRISSAASKSVAHTRTVPHTIHQPSSPKLPEVLKTYPSCSFVLSASLLKQRHISKLIERLYPNADFISRDFDLPYVTAEEADMILSPSTGLIITTLQEIKQRALPGQPENSKIKMRIEELQSRYERLVVLIGEGFARQLLEGCSERAMDTRDLDAIDHFKKHTSAMKCDISTEFVAGGNLALAQAITEEMAKYGLPGGSKDIGDIKLLPDETQWEIFLRRAGLNPFAAQVILALLKEPIEYPVALASSQGSMEENSSSFPLFGLQRFLMMSGQQRVQSFQVLLGGKRVLQKVNALLDQQWLSAAHSFHM